MTFYDGIILYAAVGASAVAVALLLLGILWRVSGLSKQVKQLNSELKTLAKNHRVAIEGSCGMGQKLLRLERQLKILMEAPKMEAVVEQPFSYTQASQMVEQGAEVDVIAATCGISHSEAHLMRKLCALGAEKAEPSSLGFDKAVAQKSRMLSSFSS
jgi:hypothetical protein